MKEQKIDNISLDVYSPMRQASEIIVQDSVNYIHPLYHILSSLPWFPVLVNLLVLLLFLKFIFVRRTDYNVQNWRNANIVCEQNKGDRSNRKNKEHTDKQRISKSLQDIFSISKAVFTKEDFSTVKKLRLCKSCVARIENERGRCVTSYSVAILIVIL